MATSARAVMPVKVLTTVRDLIGELTGISPVNVDVHDWLPQFLKLTKGFPAAMVAPGDPFIETVTADDSGDDDDPYNYEVRVYRIVLTLLTTRTTRPYLEDLQEHLALLEDVRVKLVDDLPDAAKGLSFMWQDIRWLDSTTRTALLAIDEEQSRHVMASEWSFLVPTHPVDAKDITSL